MNGTRLLALGLYLILTSWFERVTLVLISSLMKGLFHPLGSPREVVVVTPVFTCNAYDSTCHDPFQPRFKDRRLEHATLCTLGSDVYKRTDLHLCRGCPACQLRRALDPLTEKSFEPPVDTGFFFIFFPHVLCLYTTLWVMTDLSVSTYMIKPGLMPPYPFPSLLGGNAGGLSGMAWMGRGPWKRPHSAGKLYTDCRKWWSKTRYILHCVRVRSASQIMQAKAKSQLWAEKPWRRGLKSGFFCVAYPKGQNYRRRPTH